MKLSEVSWYCQAVSSIASQFSGHQVYIWQNSDRLYAIPSWYTQGCIRHSKSLWIDSPPLEDKGWTNEHYSKVYLLLQLSLLLDGNRKFITDLARFGFPFHLEIHYSFPLYPSGQQTAQFFIVQSKQGKQQKAKRFPCCTHLIFFECKIDLSWRLIIEQLIDPDKVCKRKCFDQRYLMTYLGKIGHRPVR